MIKNVCFAESVKANEVFRFKNSTDLFILGKEFVADKSYSPEQLFINLTTGKVYRFDEDYFDRIEEGYEFYTILNESGDDVIDDFLGVDVVGKLDIHFLL